MTPEMEKAIAKAKAIARVLASNGEPKREVVATTPDGGEVFRMSDGSLSFKSPNYATNDQATIERLMQGDGVKQVLQDSRDKEIIANSPVRARVQEFAQGTPLVGEWFDEAAGATGAMSESRVRGSRQLSDAMERQNPIESAALNIAGGIATTAPAIVAGAGSTAANWVAKGATNLTRAARAGLAAAPAGAIEGAASFSGRAQDGARLGAAATGAAVGGGLAGVLGTFAPMIGEGVTNLAKRIKRLDVSTIAKEFGISNDAARVVKGYLVNDDLDKAAAVLSRGGPDAMLAESGPATRQALDTAMAAGGDALSTARPRVDARVQGAAQGWSKTVDDILGEADGGIKGATKDIMQGSKDARQRAYDFAFSQPTPTVGKVADDIADALDRISPKTLSEAVERANMAMRDAKTVNMNIMASIDDITGEVTFSQPLNIQQLDQIKRALDDIARDGQDALTGVRTAEAERAGRQAARLRDALKGVDGYERALKLGGDTVRDREALVMGRKLLSETTTVEDVRNAMAGASDTQKAAARKGLRENLEAVMGRARATIADLEAGGVDFEKQQNAVAEAVAAMRSLTTGNNMKKATAVLGGDAKRLFDELEKMGDALVLRAAVARNSATAIRQAGQQAMKDEVAPNLVARTAGNLGNPLDAMKEVSQTLVGIDVRTLSAAEQKYFAEIADALTRIKGPEAQKALIAVKRAMQGQPIKDAEAQLIGRLVAGSSALGLYQAGKQPLAPRP